MFNKRSRHRKELGATLVDYTVLVAFVSALVIAATRLLGLHIACIFGAATYGLERPDRSATELRRHVPTDYVSGDTYVMCGTIN
jgi:Flp pilus assembly pilin Flp